MYYESFTIDSNKWRRDVTVSSFNGMKSYTKAKFILKFDFSSSWTSSSIGTNVWYSYDNTFPIPSSDHNFTFIFKLSTTTSTSTFPAYIDTNGRLYITLVSTNTIGTFWTDGYIEYFL